MVKAPVFTQAPECVRVPDVWVRVSLPLAKLMTAPLAKNRSENAVPLAPMAPESLDEASTDAAVSDVVTTTDPVKFAVAEIVCELIVLDVTRVVTPAIAPEMVKAPFVVKSPAE